MMELGRDVAEAAVKTLLDQERARYDLELSKKDREPPQDDVASCVSSWINFISAKAALQRLRSRLA